MKNITSAAWVVFIALMAHSFAVVMEMASLRQSVDNVASAVRSLSNDIRNAR